MTGLLSKGFTCKLWSLVYSCVFILSWTARIAFGTLHPTKPISTTVFSAGRPAQVKWVEDRHQPLLGDLGHMKIHLLAGNSTYLSTIAENVNPVLLSVTVYIPQIIPPNYHVFTLRFVPSHFPHHPIYTAPFTILPNPFSSLLPSSHPPNSAATPVSASLATPSSETVRDLDATTVSHPTATLAALPSASGKYIPSQQDSGNSFRRFELRMGWRLGGNFEDATAARRVTWKPNMETIEFSLVFLVWPALIGLSLSVW